MSRATRRPPGPGVEWEFERLTLSRDLSRNVVTRLLVDRALLIAVMVWVRGAAGSVAAVVSAGVCDPTRAGALPEVVDDAGVLVPPADPQALARAIGGLLDRPERAAALGRRGFERCMVFQSLSKRSSVTGLRSGFVAGDPALIKP